MMFSAVWLLVLAAVGTAFIDIDNDHLDINATAKVLPNRQVHDGVFQLGVTRVEGVPKIGKRQSKSTLANPYIGDIYMITSMSHQEHILPSISTDHT